MSVAQQERELAEICKVSRSMAYDSCLEEVKNALAAGVLVDKYFLCDPDRAYIEMKPQDMWHRIAKAISEPEKESLREEYEQKFYKLLEHFKFTPAGRVLYGLGNGFVKVTLKNCYVIGIQEDSIKGIFDTAYRAAETYKSGGGVGIDLSCLRPRGSAVRNAARFSTGAASFMDFFSNITGMIGQQARIGALLLGIDVSHPDVEEFIALKGTDDLNLARYANVSVKISDKFMKAVEANADFDLVWGGKTYKTIKARELWNKIIHYAWKRGEPGLLFWDKVCSELPAHNYPGFMTLITNPCLTGDMRLLTEHGYKTIRELWNDGGYQEYDGSPSIAKHGTLKIVNRLGIAEATNVYRTSTDAEVYRITLKNGAHINATANHKFILSDGRKKILSELEIGDELPINENSSFGTYDYPEYAELAGWVIGDGTLIRTKDEQIRACVRTFGDDMNDVLPILQKDALLVYNHSNKSSNQQPKFDAFDHTPNGFTTPVREFMSSVLGRLMDEGGCVPGNKHHVPNQIWQGNKETIAAFLKGLFSADGSVQISNYKKSISIRICQVNKSILQECQLLLNQFGITSSVYYERRKASQKLMNDGKGGMKLYNKKAEHELIISGRINVEKFINNIGFIQKWKNDIAKIWLSKHSGSNNSTIKKSSEIKKIEYLDNQETFCLTEPISHEIVINGHIIAQCGEAALSHGDSCDLGSVNLGLYVKKSFTKEASFDFPSFNEDVRLGIRFLDNIISLEKTPLDFQQKANDNGRRLGLGIMGLADVFLRMGMRYDSDEAIALTDKIMEHFMVSSYDASCDLAKEKGSFPIFKPETHFQSEYIKRLPGWLQEKIKTFGIRNIALHAIAPTGSLSCIAQCSSGIEPVFMMKYIRKTNLGTAKEVKEHEVIHSVAAEYMEKVGKDLPDYFVSAHQIAPDKRIKLQATIQRYIDQSISNTVNLPNDVTEEKIAYYYMQAWKNGLKGITVYRDGSREGVLVAKSEKEEKQETGIKVHQAPKRPESLKGRIHIIQPNGKKFTVFVGLLGERVFEVFALDHALAGLSDEMVGEIKRTKDSNGHDNLYFFESGCITVKHLNRYEDQHASLITRLISTSLRHGTPLEFLIDQINKSRVPINSLARAIARALSCYVKEEETKGKFKCPQCNGRNVRFKGTCFTCLDCGLDKCG